MRRVLASKTVPVPGRVHSRSAGPNKFPRYVSIGNAKKVARRFDAGVWVPGMPTRRVYLDFDKDGELIGVEIIG